MRSRPVGRPARSCRSCLFAIRVIGADKRLAVAIEHHGSVVDALNRIVCTQFGPPQLGVAPPGGGLAA
jgi:hypothetical protein